MSGGGKGGSQTTKVQLPSWVEDAAKSNLARADQIAQLGYTPYYGPDVAAFTPTQEAAFAGTNAAASAFGMPSAAATGMPQSQNFGGVQGYSSAPMYQDALAALQQQAPGQFAAMQNMFINPITGAAPGAPFGKPVTPAAEAAPQPWRPVNERPG